MISRPQRTEALVDPRAFLSSAPPDSAIWVLADAFDAATNGMAMHEAAARLSEIDEEAFVPWKSLVRAIAALYAEDPAALEAAVDRIAPGTPPAALVPLFRAWLALDLDGCAAELTEASSAVAALYRRVFSDRHPLEQLAEQADEALRHGMTDHFEALSSRVLRELRESSHSEGPLLALRYAAYCLAALDRERCADVDFFGLLLRMLGRQDGLIALGLALVGRDDSAALSAFRGALESDCRPRFADDEVRAVLRAATEILAEPERHGCPPAHDDKKRRRSREAAEREGQLELFTGGAT